MNIEDNFKKYINDFDMTDSKILGKYTHSFRVMNLSEEIAKSLCLNDKDIYIAKIIGLLHDIGRFEQLRQYDSYDDFKTMDHGDYGAKLLFEDNLIEKFNINKNYYHIIKKAIQNHNKYKIEEGLNEKELLHSKIIRDADKLDILNRCSIFYDLNFKKSKDEITSAVNNQFYLEEQIDKLNKKNINDNYIVMLSFPYDFNYIYSFKYLVDNNIFEVYKEKLDNAIFDKYFEYINKYIEKRLQLC